MKASDTPRLKLLEIKYAWLTVSYDSVYFGQHIVYSDTHVPSASDGNNIWGKLDSPCLNRPTKNGTFGTGLGIWSQVKVAVLEVWYNKEKDLQVENMNVRDQRESPPRRLVKAANSLEKFVETVEEFVCGLHASQDSQNVSNTTNQIEGLCSYPILDIFITKESEV